MGNININTEKGGLPDWYKEKYPNAEINGFWIVSNPLDNSQFIAVLNKDFQADFTYWDYAKKTGNVLPP